MRKITLLRDGNRLVVDPTTRRVRALLEPELTYTQTVFHRGKEKWDRKHAGLPTVEEVNWECFDYDIKERLATSFGFREKLTGVLGAAGYAVETRWATAGLAEKAARRAERVYRPRWDNIDDLVKSGFEFRHKQLRALKLMAKYENGRIDCHGGWGKGTVIMLACHLYPKAKIAVVTKRVPVLHQRLYPELALSGIDVGIVGGGRREKGCRVMCYSADSIHHAGGDEDLVLVDEGHEACADKFAGSMAMFEHARMWAFSASWDMRPDNKDLRGEAIFGPIRLKVPYQEGVDHGLVVPIEIYWTDVITDINPCAELDSTNKERAGIWRHDYRNRLIAKDAHLYDEGSQVIVTVKTLEHALFLKTHYLPEFKILFSPGTQKPSDWDYFARLGLRVNRLRRQTDEDQERLMCRLSTGQETKCIVTPKGNVGLDLRYLCVVVRADGTSSPVANTQIPCRNARLHREGKKSVAVIHDYRDQFDTGLNQIAKKRGKTYELHNWKQHFPSKAQKSRLRQRMEWGESL